MIDISIETTTPSFEPPAAPETLDDALQVYKHQELAGSRWLRKRTLDSRRALTSTADLICKHLVASKLITIDPGLHGSAMRKQVRLDAVVGIRPALKKFLKRRGYSGKKLVRILRFSNRLMSLAKQFGWTPTVSPLEAEWAPMKVAAKGMDGVRSMIEHAISLGRHISEYSESDQNLWAEAKEDEGCTCDYIQCVCERFCTVIRRAGLQDAFLRLNCQIQSLSRNRLKFKEMGPELRLQLLRLFWGRWKEAARCRVPINPNTERLRIHAFQSLLWWTLNVEHIDPLIDLAQALTEDRVRRWAR